VRQEFTAARGSNLDDSDFALFRRNKRRAAQERISVDQNCINITHLALEVPTDLIPNAQKDRLCLIKQVIFKAAYNGGGTARRDGGKSTMQTDYIPILTMVELAIDDQLLGVLRWKRSSPSSRRRRARERPLENGSKSRSGMP